MAKKPLKSIAYKPREKNLGLVNKAKKFKIHSFRLSSNDNANLKNIRAKMDQHSIKNIKDTDVIKALLSYGIKVDSRHLTKALGDIL